MRISTGSSAIFTRRRVIPLNCIVCMPFTHKHTNLTKGLGLVFLHKAEYYQTEDEKSHEGHSASSHYSQHGHLHMRLQELWGQNWRGHRGGVRSLQHIQSEHSDHSINKNLLSWPASVRLLCTVPTLLLALSETFPDRLLSIILRVWLVNQGCTRESSMKKSEVLANSWPDWSIKVMVAGGLDHTRAKRTRESPGSEVSL